jgi:hypothetical protein
MLFSSLALSSDSLIVTVALSAGLPPLHMVQLTALFGIFDAGASMIGPAMGAQIAAPSSIAPIFLVLWGGLIMLNMPSLALWCRRALWAYLLPPLLAIDNLVVASEQPLAAGLASRARGACRMRPGRVP